MTIHEWSKYCNKDAYGLDGGYYENEEELKFKGGRKIKYKRNTKETKTFALQFAFDDDRKNKIDGKTEFQHFIDWYENEIQGGKEPFNFMDINLKGGIRAYMLSDTPKWNEQNPKKVSMTFEEF